MKTSDSYDIAIIGGGLAGLCAAIHLGEHFKVLLIEKQSYPNHKVCGEYISNEVIPYLNSLEIYPEKLGAKNIKRFKMSTHNGAIIEADLPLGGFGISRYHLDKQLFDKVNERCTTINDTVKKVTFQEKVVSSEKFSIETKLHETFKATYVLGAFGKRSNLDAQLNRSFMRQKSPWLAVKAHYELSVPENEVSLHNFNGGYCGVSQVENGIVNVCYLTNYNSFKKVGNIEAFQKEVMSRNIHLEKVFKEGRRLWDAPLTISQISFETKEPVNNHILMIGDSAGMIHPLCGNGMAMAIHSAKLVSEILINAAKESKQNRAKIEDTYAKVWNEKFNNRVRTGRYIQRILLNNTATKAGLKVAKLFPSIVPSIINRTHGTVQL